MKIPPGLTESEVITALQTAANALAHFKFGPNDEDDIKQQAILYGLQALEKERYDPRLGQDGLPTRPLVNFVYTHMRNRLCNYFRDTCSRSDPPCRSCHENLPGQTTHPGGRYCAKYEAWLKRNMSKQNILCPTDIAEFEGGVGSTADVVSESVETSEILRIIDTKLPVSMRGDYLRMKDGESLPKARRLEVENAVREIIQESLE